MHMVYSRLKYKLFIHTSIVRSHLVKMSLTHVPPTGCMCCSRFTGDSPATAAAAAAAATAAAAAAAFMLRALVCSNRLAARVTSGDVDSGRGML